MKKSQKVLFQLDALLDTRIGTAYKLGATEIDWEGYFNRTHSKVWEFFGLGEEEFVEAYARRNVETLEISRATEMFKHIPYIMRNKLVSAASTPLHDRPEIVINYWPYNLSPTAASMIKQAVFDSLPEENRMRVSMIYQSTDKLTARYLKDNFCDYILYDLTEWLEYNNKTFEETPIPEVSIVYPATLNFEAIDKFTPLNEHDDPFASLRMILSLVVELRDVPPTLLSLDPCLLLRRDPDE